MTIHSEKREGSLAGIQANMFRKTTCSKLDALVVFVPEGQDPPPDVQQVLDEIGPQRWYPEEGGHVVRCPYVVHTFDEKLFKVEKGGWDHEHCDACSGTIDVGQSCWVAEAHEGYGYLICDDCYQKMRRKSGPKRPPQSDAG